MAVFSSRLAIPAKYRPDPIVVYAAGDRALRYGSFGACTENEEGDRGYTFRTEDLYMSLDDADGYALDNYVNIALDVTGYSSVVVTAKVSTTTVVSSWVGWHTANVASSQFTERQYINSKTYSDYTLDVTGQSIIYLKFYVGTYGGPAVLVTNIRLE